MGGSLFSKLYHTLCLMKKSLALNEFFFQPRPGPGHPAAGKNNNGSGQHSSNGKVPAGGLPNGAAAKPQAAANPDPAPAATRAAVVVRSSVDGGGGSSSGSPTNSSGHCSHREAADVGSGDGAAIVAADPPADAAHCTTSV